MNKFLLMALVNKLLAVHPHRPDQRLHLFLKVQWIFVCTVPLLIIRKSCYILYSVHNACLKAVDSFLFLLYVGEESQKRLNDWIIICLLLIGVQWWLSESDTVLWSLIWYALCESPFKEQWLLQCDACMKTTHLLQVATFCEKPIVFISIPEITENLNDAESR